MSLSDFLRSSRSNDRPREHISLDEVLGDVEPRERYRDALGGPAAYGAPARTGLYDPEPGRPEFCESDYQPYLWEMPVHPTPLLRAPLPDEAGPPGPPDYDACLMTDELFVRAMRDAIDASIAPKQPRVDEIVSDAEAIPARQSAHVFMEEPSASGPAQEIEAAITQAQAAASPYFLEPELPRPEPMYDPDFTDPFGMMGPAL